MQVSVYLFKIPILFSMYGRNCILQSPYFLPQETNGNLKESCVCKIMDLGLELLWEGFFEFSRSFWEGIIFSERGLQARYLTL